MVSKLLSLLCETDTPSTVLFCSKSYASKHGVEHKRFCAFLVLLLPQMGTVLVWVILWILLTLWSCVEFLRWRLFTLGSLIHIHSHVPLLKWVYACTHTYIVYIMYRSFGLWMLQGCIITNLLFVCYGSDVNSKKQTTTTPSNEEISFGALIECVKNEKVYGNIK